MGIISDLIASVNSPKNNIPVEEVLVGLYWTLVKSRETGLGATNTDIPCCYAQNMEDVGKLHQKSVLELVGMLNSSHVLGPSIGMAALNSIIPVDPGDGVDINAREVIFQNSYQKQIAIIGHFSFASQLKETARKVWVLELDPSEDEYPASQADQILPQADVIGITASTIINGTFDNLSKLFPPQALVVMIGPSTPLSPILFDYGVDILAGSRVIDSSTLIHYVGQGAALHKVEGMNRFTIVKDSIKSKLVQ